MIVLPGFDKSSYPLKITLSFISETEEAYGSLYKIAESLLDKSLPLSTMIGILKIIYRHAGCKVPEAELDPFFLRQPCTELLTSVLLDILEPIDRMGAITPGEFLTVQKDASI